MDIIIEFIVSFLSTLGFGIITNIPRRAMLPACFTGATAWTAYYLVSSSDDSMIMPNFLAAFIIGVLGNLFAVIFKFAVNTIYIPSLVSLVPGGIIFQGVKNLTFGEASSAKYDFFSVLIIVMALSVGFVCAEICFQMINKQFKKRHLFQSK